MTITYVISNVIDRKSTLRHSKQTNHMGTSILRTEPWRRGTSFGLRQTLYNLSSTHQDLLPRPCKFSTSGRGSFDFPTSCNSVNCSRLWNLSQREICQKYFYYFFNLGMLMFYHIFIIWYVNHFGNHIYKLGCRLKFFHIFALLNRKILSRKCHFWQTIKHKFHRIINYFSLNPLKLLPSWYIPVLMSCIAKI